MAFWNRKDKDMASKKKVEKTESKPEVKAAVESEPVIASAPAPEVESVEAPRQDETPVEIPTKREPDRGKLLDLVDQLTQCAANCRAAAASTSGVGAHVLMMQAEAYDDATRMVREKVL